MKAEEPKAARPLPTSIPAEARRPRTKTLDSSSPWPSGAMLGTSRPLLRPLPFATDPGSDGTLPGDREPQSTDPSPVPPAMQALEAHVGGLDLDVTDAKSKREERQSSESDSSRWSDASHATAKLEDDSGVEEDSGGVEEEASNQQSVNGSPSTPHKQRTPQASPSRCVTPEQRKKLEAFFEQVPLPSLAACQLLAVKMGVSLQQIEDWFSDRRRLPAAQEGLGREGHSALAGHSTAVRVTVRVSVREEQRRKRVSGERVPRVPSLGTLQQSGRSNGDWEAMDVSQAGE